MKPTFDRKSSTVMEKRTILMHRILFQRMVCWLLLLLFLQILTPGVYIHAFFGHEDSDCHPGAHCAIEPVHHHCAILKLTADQFLPPESAPLPEIRMRYRTFQEDPGRFLLDVPVFPSHGRAPPSA